MQHPPWLDKTITELVISNITMIQNTAMHNAADLGK